MSASDIGGPFRFQWQWKSYSISAVLLFAGAVLLSLGVILIGGSAQGTHQAYRFAKEGRTATGTVIKKVMQRASDARNTSYQVDYRFTAGGRQFNNSETVDAGMWDRLVEHGSVDVEYAATDPTVSRMRANTRGLGWLAVPLVGGSILGLLGGWLLVMGLLALRARASREWTTRIAGVHLRIAVAEPRPIGVIRFSAWIGCGGFLLIIGLVWLLLSDLILRQERLFHAEGVTANALVLTKSIRVVTGNNSQYLWREYHVGYRFATPDGEWVEGSDTVSLGMWRSIRERDLIPIIYLPERPARSRLVANDPGPDPQTGFVLGGTLTAVGMLLLGYYGLFVAARKRRSKTS